MVRTLNIFFVMILLASSGHAYQLLDDHWAGLQPLIGYWANLTVTENTQAEIDSTWVGAGAWNVEGDSNFRYGYYGTNSDTDYQDDNGINTILSISGGAPIAGLGNGCSEVPTGGGVLGFNRRWTNMADEILDSVVVICEDYVTYSGNLVANNWNVGVGWPSSVQYDLSSVVTHELGHMAGLGHSCDTNPDTPSPDCPDACGSSSSPLTEATMCWSLPSASTYQRDLAADDIAGIQAIYGVYDPDFDDDGLENDADNCVLEANPGQEDLDGDGEGDPCDDDDDNDNFEDSSDNCPFVSNVSQIDTDSDGNGNICDNDDDNDQVPDGADNCPLAANTDQADFDGEGQGDACDNDDDGDGILDSADNCDLVADLNQVDSDGDGEGDLCDDDDDGDGLTDAEEVSWGTDRLDNDSDNDGWIDGYEVHTAGTDPNDWDSDNDTEVDSYDNCPVVANADQIDLDCDKVGSACDPEEPFIFQLVCLWKKYGDRFRAIRYGKWLKG